MESTMLKFIDFDSPTMKNLSIDAVRSFMKSSRSILQEVNFNDTVVTTANLVNAFVQYEYPRMERVSVSHNVPIRAGELSAMLKACTNLRSIECNGGVRGGMYSFGDARPTLFEVKLGPTVDAIVKEISKLAPSIRCLEFEIREGEFKKEDFDSIFKSCPKLELFGAYQSGMRMKVSGLFESKPFWTAGLTTLKTCEEMTDAALIALSKGMNSLKTLAMTNVVAIGNDGWKALSKFPSLTRIGLLLDEDDSSAMQKIKFVAQYASNLRELEGNLAITTEVVREILQKRPSLRCLRMAKISDVESAWDVVVLVDSIRAYVKEKLVLDIVDESEKKVWHSELVSNFLEDWIDREGKIKLVVLCGMKPRYSIV